MELAESQLILGGNQPFILLDACPSVLVLVVVLFDLKNELSFTHVADRSRQVVGKSP